MGVPTSEVGYTSATARRGDHEISYEHVVALKKTFLIKSDIFIIIVVYIGIIIIIIVLLLLYWLCVL